LTASATKVVALTEIQRPPDDGFGSFADHPLPVLEPMSLLATVFVVSGYCGKRINWPSQPGGGPRPSAHELGRALRPPLNISLSAHTVTHPDLRGFANGGITREVHESRIEQKTGRAVEAFAYLYGGVNARAAATVPCEFRVACGTLYHCFPARSPASTGRRCVRVAGNGGSCARRRTRPSRFPFS